MKRDRDDGGACLRRWAGSVFLTAMAVASVAVWLHHGVVLPLKDIRGVAYGDFGSFYMAGWCALHGHDIYDLAYTRAVAETLGARKGPPVLSYPPHVATLFVPVAASFTPITAARLAILANGLCYWASISVLLRGLMGVRSWAMVAAGIIGASWFVPSWQTMDTGQINMAVLLCSALGLWAFRNARLGWCGVCLGLAALLKGVPGAVAAYFVIRRKIRPLVSMALVCALALAASLAVLGGAVHRTYLVRELPDISRRTPAGSMDVSLKSFSHRVVRAATPPPGPEASNRVKRVQRVLSGVLLLGSAALLIMPRCDTVQGGLGRLAMLMVTAMILNVWTWVHHLVMALPPLAVASGGIRAGPPRGRTPQVVALTVAFASMAVSTRTPWPVPRSGVLAELTRSSSVNFYCLCILWGVLALQIIRGEDAPSSRS